MYSIQYKNNTIQYNTIQYETMQYNIIQYNTIQSRFSFLWYKQGYTLVNRDKTIIDNDREIEVWNTHCQNNSNEWKEKETKV